MKELLEDSLIFEDEDRQEITFPNLKGMKLCEMDTDEYRVGRF